MTRRDIVLLHEVGNFRVSFDLSSGFRGLSPRGVISRGSPSSLLSWVSLVFGRMASLLVANEALSVPNVLSSFSWGETDLVHVHSVGIWSRGSTSQRDVAVSSSSEFPESYHILVEFSSLVKPLFPLPAGLSIWEGGSGHHDSELVGYSSLEGIY